MKRIISAILIVLALSLILGLSKPNATLLSAKINTLAAPSASVPEPQQQWQTIQMRVTAYCPCSKCCGDSADWITASGHKIQPDETLIAADKRYPFGTEMVVPSYNNDRPVKVLDRGSAIKNNRIDVFFPSHQQALNWGVKLIDVQIRIN